MSQNINFSLFSQNAHALHFMCKTWDSFYVPVCMSFIIIIQSYTTCCFSNNHNLRKFKV